LLGGWVQRTREVIEVPVTPVRVVEYVFLTRHCPLCRKRVRATAAGLTGLAVGRQRLGIRLVSLIATLREDGRLPIAAIQRVLARLYRLKLSRGAIVAASQRVARAGEAQVAAIREAVRASPVVHVDETGWRESGANGFVWTFSTPTLRYFRRGSRASPMLTDTLGPAFAGTLVSDFYAVYTQYPGVHQFCWAHLLRDIHELKTRRPQDAGLARWARRVQRVYRDAKVAAATLPTAPARARRRKQLEARLLAAGAPYRDDPKAAQRGLCQRIERHSGALFTFVTDPRVPADNNAAERSLRPLVVARKISGGTRSPLGSDTKMALATLFGTWHLQEVDVLAGCRQLLLSPQP
jgi:hypothetical protein